ncbi:MAG TPA: STAS domain-containing protein [Vicinamibacterales bacterium]|nr:STAS domain-containing protein [Vicinamibacterales bacterium]
MKSVWRLEIDREIQDGVLVLRLGGRLGTASSGALIDAVIQGLAEGYRAVMLDLQEIDYMSSAGLMAVDASAGRARSQGGALVLCAACDAVRLVLEFGGLLADVPLEPSRAAGLERLRRESGPE